MTLIKPKDFKEGSYHVEEIRRNDWFSLLKIRSSNFIMAALTKQLFVIVLDSDPRKVIAEDIDLDAVIVEWDWIQENMTKYLVNDDLMREDLMLLLLGKIEAIAQVQAQERKEEKVKISFLKQFGLTDYVISSKLFYTHNSIHRLIFFSA